MTDQNKTEIVCILDRSGSMGVVVTDTIGAFNNFIAEQRKVPGKASVSLVLFDDEVSPIYSATPLAKVPTLDGTVYQIRGTTALHDAVGKTINEVGNRLANQKEEDRPGRVLVMILTDGMENASREFTGPQVKQMIEHQKEKYSWQFIYLGANQDAVTEGAKIGIAPAQSMSFASTKKGMGAVGQSVSSYATQYRNASNAEEAASVAWSPQDRAQNDPDQAPVAGTIQTTKP